MAKEPKFFWRGVMIAAPVLVLTALGCYSLKQDRLLAEAQARERAQELADSFANEIMAVLQKQPSTKDGLAFELDSAGKLVFPPPVAPPAPEAPRDAGKAYSAAIGAMNEGRTEDALIAFEAVTRDYPDAIGETGLPLKPLAQLKWLELAKGAEYRARAAAVEEALGSNAVFRPSLITPQILQRLSNDKWQKEWERHERIRSIFYQSARQELRAPFPPLMWAGEWLLVRQEGDPLRYACWHANMVEGKRGQGPFAFTASITPPEKNWNVAAPAIVSNPFNRKLLEFAGRLPRYFDYTLALAGKPIATSNQLRVLVRQSGGKGSGQTWSTWGVGSPPTTYGATSRTEKGTEYLNAAIYLISPQMLYERERERALWFGLLIAASVVAASAGCYSAWRAFQRQQRLAELKSDFVSSVSHELRAPIASVRLMAEGLERGSVTEQQKQHEYFRFIVQECRRLGSMIENVLDFSRIEQGRKEYEFEPTDLARLVEQTVKFMQPYAAERQVKLASEITSDIGEVQVDGRAIQQALVNLIDNAIKHSPQGKQVWVTCSRRGNKADPSGNELFSAPESGSGLLHSKTLSRDSEGFGVQQSSAALDSAAGGHVRLCVRDQGPGIPPGERQKIFEKFYRCGSELRRETQGVGIGLSIVKHIVDAHRGTITVSGEPGKGSTFTLTLPRQQTEDTNES